MRKNKKSGNPWQKKKMKCVENIDVLTKNSGVCKIQFPTAILLTIRCRKIYDKAPPYTCNKRCMLRHLVRCAKKKKVYVKTPR